MIDAEQAIGFFLAFMLIMPPGWMLYSDTYDAISNRDLEASLVCGLLVVGLWALTIVLLV